MKDRMGNSIKFGDIVLHVTNTRDKGTFSIVGCKEYLKGKNPMIQLISLWAILNNKTELDYFYGTKTFEDNVLKIFVDQWSGEALEYKEKWLKAQADFIAADKEI